MAKMKIFTIFRATNSQILKISNILHLKIVDFSQVEKWFLDFQRYFFKNFFRIFFKKLATLQFTPHMFDINKLLNECSCDSMWTFITFSTLKTEIYAKLRIYFLRHLELQHRVILLFCNNFIFIPFLHNSANFWKIFPILILRETNFSFFLLLQPKKFLSSRTSAKIRRRRARQIVWILESYDWWNAVWQWWNYWWR